ncbi:MAG: HEAT repeat domain-containing protein [Bacteroidetes bacterium]|nr:HEAT repeat domain-containing protein [Bacteroidota bacterium]
MENEKRERMLIDYIEGNLSDAERAMIENEMAQNIEVREMYDQLKEVMGLLNQTHPIKRSHSLQANFEKMLQQEITKSEKNLVKEHSPSYTKTLSGRQVYISSWVLRTAAVLVLVLIGVVIMNDLNHKREHEKEVATIKKELNDNKKLMMTLLQNQQSASQRLQGATAAYEMNNTDDEIVKALVNTMNEDTNSNVRLTALEALGKFYWQNHVRSALIKSLTTQKDPVVQMALIRMLVQMKEKEVITQLEKITRENSVIKAVKDEAHWGILKLS